VGDLATIDVQQKQLEQSLKAASNKIDLYQQQMNEKEAELRQLRAATQADDDDGGGGLAGGSSEVRENAFPAPLVYQNGSFWQDRLGTNIGKVCFSQDDADDDLPFDAKHLLNVLFQKPGQMHAVLCRPTSYATTT
jgi:hypothetical protein